MPWSRDGALMTWSRDGALIPRSQAPGAASIILNYQRLLVNFKDKPTYMHFDYCHYGT